MEGATPTPSRVLHPGLHKAVEDGAGVGEVNSTEFVGKGLQGCREGGVSSAASERPQAGAPARRPQVQVRGLGTQTCASD